jgi:hypothetical protein
MDQHVDQPECKAMPEFEAPQVNAINPRDHLSTIQACKKVIFRFESGPGKVKEIFSAMGGAEGWNFSTI